MTDDNDNDTMSDADYEALEQKQRERQERQQAAEHTAMRLFETSGHDLGDAITALLEAADEYRSVDASTSELDDMAVEFITDLDAAMAFSAVVFHFGGDRLLQKSKN